MRKKTKSFFKMTDAERAADVKKYDRGVPLNKTRALSRSAQAKWGRARAADPAPSTADNLARILIAVDAKLLAKTHARAVREGKTLSALVSELFRKADSRPATRRTQARHRQPV